MSKSLCRNMNPFEIEQRFSNKQGYDRLEYGGLTFKDYEPFFRSLPEREQDLIEMYYRKEKKQKEIAEFFGVTQGAVSHRLSRAKRRLKFLRDMPKLERDVGDVLLEYFKEFDTDLIRYMIETTCQSKTADLLNDKYGLQGDSRMTQVKVRHRFDRSIQRIAKIKRLNKELKVCYKLLEHVRNNLYMLHEVILPRFKKGHRAKYKELV